MTKDKTPNIEAIRGDLNTFSKMARAVEFAVASVEDHNARVARNKELDRLNQTLAQDVTNTREELAAAKGELKKAKESAGSVVTKANEDAAEIISQAKIAAAKITDEAQAAIDALKEQKKTLTNEVGSLTREITAKTAQKAAMDKDIARISGDLETTANRLKG